MIDKFEVVCDQTSNPPPMINQEDFMAYTYISIDSDNFESRKNPEFLSSRDDYYHRNTTAGERVRNMIHIRNSGNNPVEYIFYKVKLRRNIGKRFDYWI